MFNISKKNAFTLVELIVVIVILAILATIAFLSFSSQSASARDSTRLSDMNNIAKGLSVFNATSGSYPKPDSYISLTASGVNIGYQGYAGSTVLNMIKISNGGKDPLDTSTYYTYSTNASQSKFQILGFLEDGSSSALSYMPFPKNIANADPSSYSGRYVITKGDVLGILLSTGGMVPVQSQYSAGSFTGVDIMKTALSYVFQFDNKTKITGTGIILKSGISRNGLILHWSFDECSGTGIKDISGNGNNGTITYPAYGVYQSSINGGCNISLSGNTSTSTGTMDANSMINNLSEITLSYNINKTLTGTTDWEVLFIHDAFWYHVMPNGDIMMRSNLENVPGRLPYSFFVDDRKLNVAPYLDGVWHNHAITLGKGNLKYFIDGKLVYKTTMINNSTVSSAIRGFGIYNAKLKMDELRVYNIALSDSEIANLYNSTK